jgi:hypothetical protein
MEIGRILLHRGNESAEKNFKVYFVPIFWHQVVDA